jgi:hypothetical protein
MNFALASAISKAPWTILVFQGNIKRMPNRAAALASLGLLVLTAGCYPGTVDEVVNHSGQRLIVISLDTALKQTPYVIEDGQTVRINVPFKLRVVGNGVTWNYDLPPYRLPDSFRKKTRGNWYLEKFQIEKDGSLNCLFPDSLGPVEDLPQQPAGYPVRPK